MGTDRAVTVASDSLRSLLQMREQLPLRGAVTEQVLRGVQQVPVLSDEEDVEQIEGLMRLARLLGVSAGVVLVVGFEGGYGVCMVVYAYSPYRWYKYTVLT